MNIVAESLFDGAASFKWPLSPGSDPKQSSTDPLLAPPQGMLFKKMGEESL